MIELGQKLKRDEMHRCKYCRVLFADVACVPDPVTGALQCPNGCKESFSQPPYESPFQDDTNYQDNTKEM